MDGIRKQMSKRSKRILVIVGIIGLLNIMAEVKAVCQTFPNMKLRINAQLDELRMRVRYRA